MTDTDLLLQFARSRDAESFRQLVVRHADLVYSAAVRQLGSRTLADDVTQAVFIMLARKAGSVNGATLAGWLVTASRLAALQALRAESRRRSREHKAAEMKTEVQTDPTGDWNRVSPLLDEALAHLSDADRSAVTLRYLEGKSVDAVALAMGISEAAAAKRIARAIARLRNDFARRGIALPVASIAALLLQYGRLSCPPHVLGGASALASAETSALAGTAAASIATGALATIAAKTFWSAVAAGVALLLVASAATFFTVTRNPSSATAPPPTARIKIGVLAIRFADKGPAAQDRLSILNHLSSTEFDVRPIIDPGMADDMTTIGGYATMREAQAKPLRDLHFNNAPGIDGTDVRALKELDVIIAPREWTIREEVLRAVHSAVTDGVGLLDQTIVGLQSPGMQDPPMLPLHGMTEADYFYVASSSGAVPCVVVGDHPLLAGLRSRDLKIRGLNGLIGTFSGTPLIAAPNRANQRPGRSSGPLAGATTQSTGAAAVSSDFVFYPLYVSQLGRGRIVGCQWYTPDPPLALTSARGENFYVRCVHWLAAGRTPASAPSAHATDAIHTSAQTEAFHP
jgi:RNA polymerase sigma factor (sigma-70 family)